MAAYTVVFYIYKFMKSSLLKQIFITVSLIIFVIVYAAIEDDSEKLLNRLGKNCY